VLMLSMLEEPHESSALLRDSCNLFPLYHSNKLENIFDELTWV
jgi:hypothetical protein